MDVKRERAIDVRAAAADAARAPLLLSVPHRFFFLAAVAAIVIDSLWWAWVLAARIGLIAVPPAALPDTVVHALAMTLGFSPLFMFGFLFTAGPRWLSMPAPTPRAWLVPGILAACGALSLVPLQLLGPLLGDAGIRIGAFVYALGWALLLIRFAALVRASPQADKLHARLLLVSLAIGAAVVAAFAVFGPRAHPWVRDAGFWCFLLPVFTIVCHRMIPFFTSSVVPFVTAFRPGWLLGTLFTAPVAHGVLAMAGFDGATWVVDLPIAVLLLWLTLRWGFVQSMTNHLLAMLHVGFLWCAIGFLLAGVQSLLALSGSVVLALAPLHALAIGFAGSLTMAMVTRVTCGHSGRTLAADALTWALFQLLQATTLLRIVAELLPGSGWLLATAVLWCACFVPWCVKYAPVYWRPREDGRPG